MESQTPDSGLSELKDMKAKVNGVEESVVFINKQYEYQTKEVLAVKKPVFEMTNVNEKIVKELSLVKSEFGERTPLGSSNTFYER